MDKPIVSVIVPVYNVRKYLACCLDSIIGQSYSNLNIIVVDDGSSDGSGAICDDYMDKDPRVSVIHTHNHGLSAARNKGLENSVGEFIMFVDSDDWLERCAVEKLYVTAIETRADIVCAEYFTEYPERTVSTFNNSDSLCVLNGDEILVAYVDGVLHEVVWNKLYRRRCFSELRFPDGRNYEDVFMNQPLMKSLATTGGIVSVLPEQLFHFRMRISSISHVPSYNTVLSCWDAYLHKYTELPEFQEKVLPGCFGAIGKMWFGFYGFSSAEKKESENTIHNMCAFSRRNFLRIMRGNHSKYVKALCLISQSESRCIMWLIYVIHKWRLKSNQRKSALFE